MARQERNKTKYAGVYWVKSWAKSDGRPEKIFYITYRKGGKLIEEKAGRQFENVMTAARASYLRGQRIEGAQPSNAERRKAAEEARKAKANTWTIDKLWQEYQRQKPGLKGIGPDRNRYDKYIRPSFGDMEPKSILPLDVGRVRLRMLKTKSPQTVKLTLALLRRLVNFGAKKRLCDNLPFTIELPKVNNEKTEDVSPEELERLLKAIDGDTHPQAGAMMKLVLFTGMRRGELFRLKWEHVDFERGFIKIVSPKGGIDQVIPLNDAARSLLESHPKIDSPFVFPGLNGGQRKDIHHQVNRIKERAGLAKDFRALHGLRHVYASMLASSGKVDLYTLQKLLTHKSPVMTQRYAHLRDEALKKASALAGDLISEAMSRKKGLEESSTCEVGMQVPCCNPAGISKESDIW